MSSRASHLALEVDELERDEAELLLELDVVRRHLHQRHLQESE